MISRLPLAQFVRRILLVACLSLGTGLMQPTPASAGLITHYSYDWVKTHGGSGMRIPDGTTYAFKESRLRVSDHAGTVNHIEVTIDSLTHPCVSDLKIQLESPSGARVILWANEAGCAANITDAVFNDDTGAASITTATTSDAPFTGTWAHSTANAYSLESFDGEDPNGTWKLRIRDDIANDNVGTFQGWTLHVESAAP